MSSRNYEENGYGHHLDLLIILHELLCVSNPMRIGCRAKSINFKVHLPYVWDRAWLQNAPKHVSIPGAMEVKFYESNDNVGQKHLDMNWLISSPPSDERQRLPAKKRSGSVTLKHGLGWGWACWSSETSAGGCSDRFVSCSSGTTPDERSGHVSAHPRHRHANVGAAAMISVTVMNQSLASQASQGRHNTEGCRV